MTLARSRTQVLRISSADALLLSQWWNWILKAYRTKIQFHHWHPWLSGKASALDMRRTWVRLLASVKFFIYSFVSILQMQPLRSVGRFNFDKGRHNLTTMIQKSTNINESSKLTQSTLMREKWITVGHKCVLC